jgi:hypothetical protein
MRLDGLITLIGAAAVAIFTCSKLHQSYYENRSLLSSRAFHLSNKANFQSLGQDNDWNVHKWSKKHLTAVSADNLDKRSVKNIWHSKSEAWSGIDRIFPTEGGYAYQTNHFLNGKASPSCLSLSPPTPTALLRPFLVTCAYYHLFQSLHFRVKCLTRSYVTGNEAKLLDYMKMVKTTLKGMEAHLPASAPKSLQGESTAKFEQESKEVRDIISSESEAVSGVFDQVWSLFFAAFSFHDISDGFCGSDKLNNADSPGNHGARQSSPHHACTAANPRFDLG